MAKRLTDFLQQLRKDQRMTATLRKTIDVLLVLGNSDDAQNISGLLSQAKRLAPQVKVVKRYDEALVQLMQENYQICFADDRIGEHDIFEFLHKLKVRTIACPVIVLSAGGTPDRDLEFLRSGAADFLLKRTLKPIFFERAIHYALERQNSREDVLTLEKQMLMDQKMKALGQLASSMSNQLGSILRHLRKDLEKIKASGDTAPEAEVVQHALNECLRGETLVGQLLSSSLHETQMQPGLNLQQLVLDTVTMLSRTLNKNVSITTSVFRKHELIIRGNPAQIRQSLVNLVLNSQEAMNSEGGSIHLSFSVVEKTPGKSASKSANQRYVRLELSDTGTGIDAEIVEKIFEPFYTTKRKQNALGLGLSAVYSIMQAHNGKVEVLSQEGRGATFALLFPLSEPVNSGYLESVSNKKDSSTSTSKATAVENKRRLSRGLVMLIDRDPTNLQLMRLYLESANFTPRVFDDSSEAISWYSSHSEEVDLIMINPNMPRIGGIACYQTIKRINSKVPVGLCSEHCGKIEQALINEGALRHFETPANYPLIISWIAETLGNL